MTPCRRFIWTLATLLLPLASRAFAVPTGTIACGETQTRLLGALPEELAFYAKKGEVIAATVIAVEPSSGFVPRWRIADVEGEPVALSGGSHRCVGRCVTAPLPSGGVFTLRISDSGVGRGEYVVTLEAVSATAHGRSNGPPTPTCARLVEGSPDGTRAIAAGETLDGTITPRGETDTFTTIADVGESLRICVDRTGGDDGFAPVWQAFDPAGMPIARASDDETAPLDAAGVVTILVADAANGAAGSYSIELGCEPRTTTTTTATTSSSSTTEKGATTTTDDDETTTTKTTRPETSTTSTLASTTVTTSSSSTTSTTATTPTSSTLPPAFDLEATVQAPAIAGVAGPAGGRALAAGDGFVAIGVPHDDAGSDVEQGRDVGAVIVIDAATPGFGAVHARLVKPGTPASGEQFGAAVALGGGALVGAPGARQAFFFASVDDPNALLLAPPAGGPNDRFGAAVAIADDLLLVGAPGADGGGAVYVFERATGLPHATFRAADAIGFGSALAAASGRVLVGAPGDDTHAGAAYVLDLASGAVLQRLVASTSSAGDGFGTATAFVGGDAVVGAPGAASGQGSVERFAAGSGAVTVTYARPSPAAGGRFGAALATGDDLVVVGAPAAATGGVPGGVAYEFDADGGALRATLHRDEPSAGDDFGAALAIAAPRIYVGAPGDDSGTVDGGVTYVFEATTVVAAFRERLSADAFGAVAAVVDGALVVGAPAGADGRGFVGRIDAAHADVPMPIESPSTGSTRFGASLTSLGGAIVVGAPRTDGLAGERVGAVYLYPAGGEPVTIANPRPLAGDEFGFAVGTVDGDLLASAPFAAETDTGVVYRLRAPAGTVRVTYTKPVPAAGDFFGAAVAGDAGQVLVGAPFDAGGGATAGAAYLFDALTADMVHVVPNPEASSDLFGAAVALGQWIVVGAPLASGGGASGGAVYVIDRATGAVLQRLANPRAAAGDSFGAAVALVGDRVIVGAPLADDGAADAGTAYLFDGGTGTLLQTLRDPPQSAFDQFGFAVAGAPGSRLLVGSPGPSRVYVFDPIAVSAGLARFVARADPAPPTQTCGNGLVEGTEACDDGNDVDTDDCRNDCTRGPCCTLDAARCDDGDPCTTDVLDAGGGCRYVPNGAPGCCADDADCPGGQCRVCLGCFIYKWDCCDVGSQCVPSNPACADKTCVAAAYCQCEGKLDCGAEAVPQTLRTLFAAACDTLRLETSVAPDGTPVTKAELVLARQHARSAVVSLRKTVRMARALVRKHQLSRACRKQVLAEVKVVRKAIPRGKQLRRCVLRSR